jgi:hypothetical protein
LPVPVFRGAAALEQLAQGGAHYLALLQKGFQLQPKRNPRTAGHGFETFRRQPFKNLDLELRGNLELFQIGWSEHPADAQDADHRRDRPFQIKGRSGFVFCHDCSSCAMPEASPLVSIAGRGSRFHAEEAVPGPALPGVRTKAIPVGNA